MDNIVPFLNGKTRYLKPVKNDSISDSMKQFLYLGNWEFTCPQCLHETKFNCSGMIFRVVEFYCDKCGKLHKVVNPAFSQNTK